MEQILSPPEQVEVGTLLGHHAKERVAGSYSIGRGVNLCDKLGLIPPLSHVLSPTSTHKAVLSHMCLLCAALSPSPDSWATSLGGGLLCVKKMPWITKMMNGGHSVLDSVK